MLNLDLFSYELVWDERSAKRLPTHRLCNPVTNSWLDRLCCSLVGSVKSELIRGIYLARSCRRFSYRGIENLRYSHLSSDVPCRTVAVDVIALAERAHLLKPMSIKILKTFNPSGIKFSLISGRDGQAGRQAGWLAGGQAANEPERKLSCSSSSAWWQPRQK